MGNPSNHSGLWCYTKDPQTRWEDCNEPKYCRGGFAITGQNTCGPDTTRETIWVGSDDRYTFLTNKPMTKYGNQVKCKVRYKKKSSCKKISILCYEFHLVGKDYLMVMPQGKKKQRFTGKKGPNLSTSRNVRLYFRTNKEGRGPG